MAFRTLATFAVLGACVFAQTKYGENHIRVNFDSEVMIQNAFPEPNVTLRSPAFLPNASFDQGWFKGTEGATSHLIMGTYSSRANR